MVEGVGMESIICLELVGERGLGWKVFYVPERSIMHLTVSARFLISSGRGGE